MDTVQICKECGAALTTAAPEGLCPKCLLKAGLGSETGNPQLKEKRRQAAAPPPEQIARFFPQLEILELLGQGGMGMVYKARQPQLDRFVALKILSPDLSRDPAFAERFVREAKALGRLNHPNIVGVYDFGQAGEFYYFIMEYVDGMNLSQMEQTNKPLAPEAALAIVPKICDALQYAHEEGIVHRDIKPGNILIDKKGRVKIADFGLAKLLGQATHDFSLTQSKMMLGTPQYMAPEQIEDPQKVDHRADIYSLGVVFYEMLTGELPLGRFALPSEKVRVDVRLDEVVLRALARKPELRYQHASDVRTAVESLSAAIEKLPPHLRRAFGYEYKSKRTLWGLPLVHISYGLDPATGKSRPAKGIIAVGDGMATGVIACGGMAVGVVAFGGLSIGVVSLGGGALGLIGIGGAAVCLLLAIGGLAVAPIAAGGGAVGYYAFGGGAWGVHAYGGNSQDLAAKELLGFWSEPWVTYAILAFALVSSLVLSLVPIILRRRASQATSRTASTAALAAPSAEPTGKAAASGQQRDDRFWKRFAVAIAVGLLALILIPAGAILLAIILPAWQRAHTPHVQQLAEFNWQKLAEDGRLLGGVPTNVDGRVVLRIENTNNLPLQLALLKITQPPITSKTYALAGEIEYQNVQGDGFLEMWNCFPPPGSDQPELRAFSRTMDVSGPLGKISGTSSWREFSLPFNSTGAPGAPTRLEVNIFLPGRGVVFLGPTKLTQF